MSKKTSSCKYVISVCSGEDCLERKSKKLRRRLQALVKGQGLFDFVRVRKERCFKVCESAPVVEVQPGGRQYKKVTPKRAEEFLDRMLSKKIP